MNDTILKTIYDYLKPIFPTIHYLKTNIGWQIELRTPTDPKLSQARYQSLRPAINEQTGMIFETQTGKEIVSIANPDMLTILETAIRTWYNHHTCPACGQTLCKTQPEQ